MRELQGRLHGQAQGRKAILRLLPRYHHKVNCPYYFETTLMFITAILDLGLVVSWFWNNDRFLLNLETNVAPRVGGRICGVSRSDGIRNISISDGIYGISNISESVESWI